MVKIIDIHTHVFPDNIAKKAAEFTGSHYGYPMESDGTVTQLRNALDEFSDIKAVIHSAATVSSQVQSVNTFVADCLKQDNRFIGFGTLHNKMRNHQDEIKRIIDLGLVGIKMHPDFQGFDIDDVSMYRIYEELSKYDMPVLVHLGDEKFTHSQPHKLRNMIDMFPNITFIGAHLGGHGVWDHSMDYLVGQNLYFDTSSAIQHLTFERSKEIIRTHGVDKILFGSDYPMTNPKTAYNHLMELGLEQDEIEKILYQNARKLLGL